MKERGLSFGDVFCYVFNRSKNLIDLQYIVQSKNYLLWNISGRNKEILQADRYLFDSDTWHTIRRIN